MSLPATAVLTAEVGDAPRLRAIYAPYVTDTAISFEDAVPDVPAFAARIAATRHRFPYLKAVRGGEIVGYAYAGAFHPRAAYRHCAELSVYVRRDCRRAGVGRRLYAALEAELARRGFANLYACVAVPAVPRDPYLNLDSYRFHLASGFTVAGRFRQCGRKFGRVYHMVWLEKLLRPVPGLLSPPGPPDGGAPALPGSPGRA